MSQPGLDGEENDSSRVGFSPAQWVRGRASRSMASVMSEEQFAEVGAIEARHEPPSIFALQHMARIEAQRLMYILNVQGVYSVLLQRMLLLFQGNFPLVIWSLSDVTIKRRCILVTYLESAWP